MLDAVDAGSWAKSERTGEIDRTETGLRLSDVKKNDLGPLLSGNDVFIESIGFAQILPTSCCVRL